jgi:hypothetical protein
MRIVFACALVIASVGTASAQYLGAGAGLSGTGSNPSSHSVSPYVNSNGAYVAGHNATNPNNTQRDNFGTRGNVNPNTGAIGTRGVRY